MEQFTEKQNERLQKLASNYAKKDFDRSNYEIGGGIASSGLFESRRHEAAKQDAGKETLGKFIQKIKKITGMQTSIIKEIIKDAYCLEWHHAGRLPKEYGGGMKKTYFINSEQANDFCSNFSNYIKKYKEKEAEKKLSIKAENLANTLENRFLKKWATPFFKKIDGFFDKKNCAITNRYMIGKYGEFPADDRYNLDTYIDGWKFRSKKKYDEYHQTNFYEIARSQLLKKLSRSKIDQLKQTIHN